MGGLIFVIFVLFILWLACRKDKKKAEKMQIVKNEGLKEEIPEETEEINLNISLEKPEKREKEELTDEVFKREIRREIVKIVQKKYPKIEVLFHDEDNGEEFGFNLGASDEFYSKQELIDISKELTADATSQVAANFLGQAFLDSGFQVSVEQS